MTSDLLKLLLQLGRIGCTRVVVPKGAFLVANGEHILAKAQRRRGLHLPIHQHLLGDEVPKLDPAVRSCERYDIRLLLPTALDQTQIA